MPHAPQENREANLQDKRRIYQEVIEKASQELHAEFLKLIGPLDGNSKKLFKKNLKSLMAHAHNPGALLRVTNAIHNYPQVTQFVTRFGIPLIAGLGISYAFSEYPARATDVVVGGTTNVIGSILSVIPGTGTARQNMYDFHRDSVRVVQTVSIFLIFALLYKFDALLAIGFLAVGMVYVIQAANYAISYPNPPDILKEFTKSSKLQRELAWSFYNLFFIDDNQRNADKRLKEILAISKEGEQPFNEARHQLHPMLYGVYKEVIKTYADLNPSAFNKKGKANDKYLFKAVLKDYLESVILVPAYFLKKHNYDGYRYNDLIPAFLKRINHLTGNAETARKINQSIDRINDLLQNMDEASSVLPLSNGMAAADNKLASPYFKPLFDAFNSLLERFSDRAANENGVSNPSRFFNPLCDQLRRFTDRFPKLDLAPSNIAEKQAIASDCNLFLKGINDFLGKSASCINRNQLLPGITDLLGVFDKLHHFQRQSTNELPTASWQPADGNADVHFSTPALDLFLGNITDLLKRLTKQLPNVPISATATPGETLSAFECNSFLTEMNDFLTKATDVLPNILSAEFAGHKGNPSSSAARKPFLDSICDLLGKFTDIFPNLPSAQSDDPSIKNLSLPELKRLTNNINRFKTNFDNWFPSANFKPNNPWPFKISDKLGALGHKVGNIIPQLGLPQMGELPQVGLPKLGLPQVGLPKLGLPSFGDVAIPMDGLERGKTNPAFIPNPEDREGLDNRKKNPAALPASQFRNPSDRRSRKRGELSSESSAISGFRPRPGISAENLRQIQSDFAKRGYSAERIQQETQLLFIGENICSLLEKNQSKIAITPELLEHLKPGVYSLQQQGWSKEQIDSWILIKTESFQNNAGLQMVEDPVNSSSSRKNYSTSHNRYAMFQPNDRQGAERQPPVQNNFELQAVQTPKPYNN